MPKVSATHMHMQRRRILSAASRCFVDNGVHATSIQDICAESGLSVGGIYRHFENKQAIVNELFATSDEMNRQSFGSDVTEMPLGDVVRRLLAEFASPGAVEVVRLSLAMHGEALRDEQIADAAGRQLTFVRAAFSNGVRAAQRRGDLPHSLDPAALGVVLVALFEGLKPQLALDGSLDLAAVGRTVEQLLPGLFDA